MTEPTHDVGTITNDSSNKSRDTAVSSAEGRLKIDVVDKVFLLEPNQHSLVTILTQVGKVWDGKGYKGSSMQKASCGNPEFKWMEDVYGGRYCKASGAYGTGGITLTVTGAGSSSAHIFTPGDIVRNYRTGENMLVATVASTTTITIASGGRAFGTTSAAAIADGDGLYIVGNVNEEGGLARYVNMTRVSTESNYTQIFRKTVSITDTQKNTDVYGPKDLVFQRAKMATQHALDKLLSFISEMI